MYLCAAGLYWHNPQYTGQWQVAGVDRNSDLSSRSRIGKKVKCQMKNDELRMESLLMRGEKLENDQRVELVEI
jgi:hypothetical protein